MCLCVVCRRRLCKPLLGVRSVCHLRCRTVAVAEMEAKLLSVVAPLCTSVRMTDHRENVVVEDMGCDVENEKFGEVLQQRRFIARRLTAIGEHILNQLITRRC
jgi:hypothetical protein